MPKVQSNLTKGDITRLILASSTAYILYHICQVAARVAKFALGVNWNHILGKVEVVGGQRW